MGIGRKLARLRAALRPPARFNPYAGCPNGERVAELKDAANPSAPAAVPGVSVIILNLDKPELIVPLVRSLVALRTDFSARGWELQIIVGDTGSTHPEILAFYANPLGFEVATGLKYQFSANNNALALARARCDHLLFLNNDVVFPAGSAALLEMRACAERSPQAGALGCCLYFADGRLQHGGVDFFAEGEARGLCYHPCAGQVMDAGAFPPEAPARAVTGAFLMVKAEHFWEAGGFDERYRAECQDIALCLSLDRLGHPARLLNLGQVLHLENQTRTRGEENWPDRRRFLRQWRSYVEARFFA